jgi:hypothetical protein
MDSDVNMANVKIKTSNGTEMEVSQDAWNSIYSKYPQKYTLASGGTPTTQKTQTSAPASGTAPTSGNVTIYFGNSSNTVPVGDLSYWQNRGWSTSKAQTQTQPKTQTQQSPRTLSTQTDANTINSLYQKYFGRNATTDELNYWSTQSNTALENQLNADYQKASGVAYDGSPIKPGQTKTVNQINTPTSQTVPSIDQTGWTDAMKQSYDAMVYYVKTLKEQGQTVNPDITIDDATIAQFKSQAETELAPYYRQTIEQANTDLKYAMEQTKKDYESSVRSLSQAYGRSLESTQQSYADRGLTFSSQRDKAESELASDYNASIESAAKSAERAAYSAGTIGERYLGSSLFPSLDSSVTTYTAGLGKPGQYGFTTAGSRSLFAPVGGQTGEAERAKLYDINQRVGELTNAEKERRSMSVA